MDRFYFLLFSIVFLQCSNPSQKSITHKIEFINGPNPILLAEGLISSSQNERDFTMSPSGDEIFFTSVSPKNRFSTIIHLKKDGDHWSDPELASFSGQFSDLEPAFHPNGKQLFFVSNRPADTSQTVKDFDIWYVELNDLAKWSDPIPLPKIVNTAANEFYPSVAQSGNLYFTATYEDSKGREDIYISSWDGARYSKPVSLDSVNTGFYEFNAFIAPDESYLLYSSFGRPDGIGGGDLYISFQKDGIWTPGKNLGEPINSTALDYCPFIVADQNLLFFTSEKNNIKEIQSEKLNYSSWQGMLDQAANGLGNIYFINFKKEDFL